MAMRTMALTTEHLQKLKALHSGEIQLPPYLTEWIASIEEKQTIFAAMMAAGTYTPALIARCRKAIVNMMLRKDMLYMKWLRGEDHKTWKELQAERPPTAEDLIKYTVADTEDYVNGPGAATFALFLDAQWPGFMKDLAHACLRDCDPLLEEGVELTPEVRRMLCYPETFFGTKHREVIEHRYQAWVVLQGIATKPMFVQRLVYANMNVAIGNVFCTFEDMQLARCEAALPKFSELMGANDPTTHTYLMAAEEWIIDQMLKQWPTT